MLNASFVLFKRDSSMDTRYNTKSFLNIYVIFTELDKTYVRMYSDFLHSYRILSFSNNTPLYLYDV